MITKQTSPTFTTDDGQKFDTIERAQEHELAVFIGPLPEQTTPHTLAVHFVAHRDKILAILNSTGRKQRVRKAAKKAKTAPTP